MAYSPELLKTPLHEQHLSAGARLVDFAGWHMPLLYTGILDEHAKTRAEATVFDVSHMGRLRIRGDSAWRLLDRVCTADVVHQDDQTLRYSLLCNEAGGVLDDIMVFRLEEEWLVVCNASNRLKVVEHLRQVNQAGGFKAKIDDATIETAMLAVQGPKARQRLADVLPFDISNVGRHNLLAGSYMMFKYIASRSGYTGEDGFEVILPKMAAGLAWKFITSEDSGVTPAGLGARDVLRLEAGLPLYGHELNETIDPITAGLDKAVRDEGDYIGAAAIAKVRQSGPARKRVGIRLATPRIARQGSAIYADRWEVGAVTSGTFSPSCNASIAMGYVDRQFAGVGQELVIRLKASEEVEAQVVEMPFFRGSAWRKGT